MRKSGKATIDVQGTAITVLSQKNEDFICLTDIARVKNADRSDDLVRNWLRNRNTVEFLGIWEQLNNPDFNSVEFDGIKMQAGFIPPLARSRAPEKLPKKEFALFEAKPSLQTPGGFEEHRVSRQRRDK